MTTLDFTYFDCDNHYYEALDAFTRHIEPEYAKRTMQWATINGKQRLLVGGQVPVVAPLARDENGIMCNVNADDAAAGIAGGLGARQLVLMTDVDGIRDASGARLDTITALEAEALIADGTIRGGMVPKVRAALMALAWEGSETIIADGSAEHALARALDDPAFGTRVSAGSRAGAA